MPLEWHMRGFGAAKRKSSVEGGVCGGGTVLEGGKVPSPFRAAYGRLGGRTVRRAAFAVVGRHVQGGNAPSPFGKGGGGHMGGFGRDSLTPKACDLCPDL